MKYRNIYLLIYFSLVFFILSSILNVLPDYFTYNEIYDSGGGHLAYFKRDPLFLLIVKFFSFYFPYELFRYIFLFFTLFFSFFAIKSIISSFDFKLNHLIILFISFIPIFIIKYGVQIREGICISLWLFTVFTYKSKPNFFAFLFLSLTSSSIHLASLPLWVLLGFYYYIDRSRRISNIFSILFYMVFLLYVTSQDRLLEDAFSGVNSTQVEFDLFKFLYFSFYIILMFYIVLFDNKKNNKVFYQFNAFNFFIRNSLVGTLICIFYRLISDIDGFFVMGLISDLMRVISLILMIYLISLALSGYLKKTLFLLFFLIVDIIRIIVAA